MKFLIFFTLFIILTCSLIPISFSDNSSVTEHGFFGVEQDTYILEYGDEFQLVKISGIADVPQGSDRAKAVITITNPDSTQNSHRTISGSDGYFELTFPLYYHSQIGIYKVFATFDKHVLGEVFFTVERISITESGTNSNSSTEEAEHVFEFRTSMFEVATDSLFYEKDEIIHIVGVVPTQPNLDLTLQIIDPMNNRILINQITPELDGTFEDSINTNGPLWKFEGDYTVRIHHNEQDLYSTFTFSIPKNEVVPNPIESSTDIKPVTPPVVTPPPPPVVTPPPPPVVQQEPVQTPQVQEESDPTGGIVVLVVIFIIILIIAKKKSGKKKGQYSKTKTYTSTSKPTLPKTVKTSPIQSHTRTSPTSIPTKIDNIKVAIEKIDSLIRRNKNKIAECNEELAYYRGPQGGDHVTKDAMVVYYQGRIEKLEYQNNALSRIRGFCEEEDTKFAIEYLDIEISNNQEYINDNHDDVRSYESQNLDSITTPIVLEFLEKTRAEFQIEMNSCNEIKQILKNFKNSKKTKKQPLITKFKSMPEKLDKRYSEIEKAIDDNRNYYTSLELTAAQKMLNDFKIAIDGAKNHIKEQTNDYLQTVPDDMITNYILMTENLIKSTDEALEDIKKHGSENKSTPERDEALINMHNKLLKKIHELEIEIKDHSKFYKETFTNNFSIPTLLEQLKTLESQLQKRIDEPNLIKRIDVETEKNIGKMFQLCDQLMRARIEEENKEILEKDDENEEESLNVLLSEREQYSKEMDEHTCPKCNKITIKFHKDPTQRNKSEIQLIEKHFGLRGSRIQSYCRECRSSKYTKKEIDPKLAAEIKKELGEFRIQLENQKKLKKKRDSKPKEVEIKITPKKPKTTSEGNKILYSQCEEVLKYKRKVIDKNLIVKCIQLWEEEKMSVEEICKKIYWLDNSRVRRHIQTPERLPNNLIDEISKIISDPESIMAISYYSTDYFRWNGKKSDEEKVLKLGKKLAEGFAKSHNLRRKLMGKRI